MTHKSTKTVSRRKGRSLPRPRSGGLTCTERQVDDVLSAGESTDVEHVSSERIEQNPITSPSGGLQ
jgi:hypothetical protein